MTIECVRVGDNSLTKNVDDGGEIFNQFLVAIHNHVPGTERLLVDVIAGNPAAIQRLESFLRPPSPYSPWKVGFETANQWGHSSRGRIIQFFEAHHGNFKTWKNLDIVEDGVVKHSKGLDFQHPTDLGRYAELKTTAATEPKLVEMLVRSFDEVGSKGGHTLEFHVRYLRGNPKPDLLNLKQSADDLTNSGQIIVKIIVEPIDFLVF